MFNPWISPRRLRTEAHIIRKHILFPTFVVHVSAVFSLQVAMKQKDLRKRTLQPWWYLCTLFAKESFSSLTAESRLRYLHQTGYNRPLNSIVSWQYPRSLYRYKQSRPKRRSGRTLYIETM